MPATPGHPAVNRPAHRAPAGEPFHFYTRLNLTKLTGLRASNLSELIGHLGQVPGSCIYHHTHRFLQQHQFLSPEPPNDFAYWVERMLGDDELGERLASIDTVQFSSIRALRTKILDVLEDHLHRHPTAKLRFVDPGDEFHFMQSESFIFPTHLKARTLAEFADCLEEATLDSVYFHMMEAKLRLRKKSNDFSYWIESALGHKVLAARIARLDPYTYTLADLRATIVRMVRAEIGA